MTPSLNSLFAMPSGVERLGISIYSLAIACDVGERISRYSHRASAAGAAIRRNTIARRTRRVIFLRDIDQATFGVCRQIEAATTGAQASRLQSAKSGVSARQARTLALQSTVLATALQVCRPHRGLNVIKRFD